MDLNSFHSRRQFYSYTSFGFFEVDDDPATLRQKVTSPGGTTEQAIKIFEQQNQQKQEKLSRLISEQNQMLEKIAGLTSEEAKKILMDNLIDEAKQDASKLIYNISEQAKLEAKKHAQNVVISAIQQSGINMALESTVSVVNLPSDDMKGRIIGREGRNICCPSDPLFQG